MPTFAPIERPESRVVGLGTGTDVPVVVGLWLVAEVKVARIGGAGGDEEEDMEDGDEDKVVAGAVS